MSNFIGPRSVTTPGGITLERNAEGAYVQKSANSFDYLWQRGLEDTASTGRHQLARPAEQSAWVRAALDLLADPVAARPLHWFANPADRDAGGSPLADATRDAFWSAPFSTRLAPLTHGDAAAMMIWWLKLKGIAFLVLGDDWLQPSRSGVRSPFVIAPPTAMRAIELTRGGEIVGWEHALPGGRRELLTPQQVVIAVQPNPYDSARGLGAYSAAANAAETDVVSGAFAKNLAAKNGQQPHYISVPGTLTDPQRLQLIAGIQDKMRRAAAGDLAVGVLTSGATVAEQQSLAVDAAFTAARIENRHEVFAALGVPMSMADIAASYSIGAASDLYRLRAGQNVPLGVKVAAAFAEVEARRSGVRLFPAFDWSGDPVMQATSAERQGAAIERTTKLWAMGVPLKDAAETAGVNLPRVAGDDIGYLPFSVAPVEGAAAPVAEKNITPVAAMLSLIEGRKKLTQPGTKPEVPPPAKTLAEGGVGGGTLQLGQRKSADKSRARLWQSHQAKRAKSERKLAGVLRRIVGDARAETLQKLTALEGKAVQKSGASLALTFDLGKFSGKMTAAVEQFGKHTTELAFSELLVEVGLDNPFVMPPAKVTEFLRTRKNYIKDASTEIHARIMGSLEQGIGEGNTTAELASRVKREFSSVTDGQAFTIARTETAAAYSASRDAAMKQSGATHKEWLTARDGDRVRDSHKAIDGTIVPIDEPFILTTDDGQTIEMMQPCASGGPPSEVINCRCISIVAGMVPEGEHADDSL